MAGIYGLSNYSSMFSTGRMSGMSSFYSNLSEYGSIRTGAYSKAVKAYYKKVAPNKTNQTQQTKNLKDKENVANVALSTVKSQANELVDSAKKLTTTGKGSLFADKNQYDKDAIYKAVSSFIDEYNDTVGTIGSVSNTTVKNAGNRMTRMTDIMSNSLSKVGISVSVDGKMSIDEEKFKNADMSRVKSLFNGNGSFAGNISSYASRIATQATNQMSRVNVSLYGSSGSFYNTYSSGSLYNDFF